MSDQDSFLPPTEPPSTAYTIAFERCWKVHPKGVKKAAWNAGQKAGWHDGNWRWLEDYLTRRHKDDQKWREGKYIPHLSTFINQERWTDHYRKVGAGRRGGAQVAIESHEEALAKIKADAARRAREQQEIRH